MNPHFAILPFIIPLTGAAIAVLLRNHRAIQAPWALGTLLTAAGVSAFNVWTIWSSGLPIVFQMGAWAAPFGITIMADLLSATMALMCQSVLVFGLIYALGAKDDAVRYPLFLPLFLALTTGLTGAMLTGDTFNLFVFLELTVISGCVLTAISDDQFGPEAALKYFYISLFATIFLLVANGALYVGYGTLNMADLSIRIAANPNAPLLWLAIATLIGTFMIKCAAVPFHFWQPDFHAAAPTAVSAMLSSVVVKVGVYGMIRATTLLFVAQADTIRVWLLAVGVIGVVFGGLGALGTHNAKRMLAYSTLAQIGFMLIGIGWGTPAGIAAAIVFMINHSLIKSAMLMLAGYLASRAPVKSASFEVIAGIGKTMPLAGALFFIGAMALAGIPPTNGFISKYATFAAGVSTQSWAVLAIVGPASIITLVYAMRAFMRVWFEPKPADAKVKPYGDSLLAPAGLIALCLALGLWGEPLTRLSNDISAWVGKPVNYVQAVLK
jgi:multicomponent Na+:H+ antiporter subunit D